MADVPGARALASGLRAAATLRLTSHHVARVIYGAIIGLALLVALEDHPPAAGVVALTLVGTAIAVALAELYSELVGTEARTRHRVSGPEVRTMAARAAAVSFGIAFPVAFFVLAAVGALETETAFTAAKWTGLGLIGFYGFCGARLSGAGLPAAALQATAVTAIGGLLIALKALLH